jgi:YD repeat-containing protein
VTSAYDGFGRLSSSTINMGGFTRTLTYLYDSKGNRTRLTHADGAAFGFDYDGLGRMILAHDKATATTSDDYIVRYWYRSSGPRQSAVRGAGTIGFSTNYYYDEALRLSTLANTLPFPGTGLVLDLDYNPAGLTRNTREIFPTGARQESRRSRTSLFCTCAGEAGCAIGGLGRACWRPPPRLPAPERRRPERRPATPTTRSGG